jgi:phospholipid-binding lipoprotein MlaA
MGSSSYGRTRYPNFASPESQAAGSILIRSPSCILTGVLNCIMSSMRLRQSKFVAINLEPPRRRAWTICGRVGSVFLLRGPREYRSPAKGGTEEIARTPPGERNFNSQDSLNFLSIAKGSGAMGHPPIECSTISSPSLGGWMILRSFLHALLVIGLMDAVSNLAIAEQKGADSQAAAAPELADENTSTAESTSPPSEAQPQPPPQPPQAEPVEPNDESLELFLEDEPDPLFDDDFELEIEEGYPDPLEEPNRAVLKFNQGLDYFLLGPITDFFGYVTPKVVKRGLRNFFDNLNFPVVFANDLLQLEWTDAAVVTGAFVVNSTVGIVGLFEPAKHIGMPRHESDFGQTLALARVSSGPYLIIPIAGPSTARGTVGSVVDFFMRPNTWLFPLSNFYYYGGEGVVTLEQHREALQELERSSVDFYSVLHSAYYQNRDHEIWGRREDRRPVVEAPK